MTISNPVSVCIPARDEVGTISALLESLLAQRPAPDEIVVADGGSTDGTVEASARFSRFGVRVLELGPALPGRGRNAAIRSARNDWVALIDAGCVAMPGWLGALTAAASEHQADAVFGTYEPLTRTSWEVAQALCLVAPRDSASGCRPPSVASMLVHRRAWKAADGFPEHLRAAEDLLFIRRLTLAGVPTARACRAVVHWSPPESAAAVFRKLRLYSRHHAAAGLQATWHSRVAAMNLAGLALAVGSIAQPSLLAPLGAAAMLRLWRTVSARRAALSASPYRPGPLLRVAFLLAAADCAMWLGLADNFLGKDGPGADGTGA